MQDLSKKIKFLKFRKKLWRSWPYLMYIKIYHFFLIKILSINKRNVKIIFINGMRRSGNHYLMKTIMDSANASIIFYNNQKEAKDLDIKNGVQVKFRFSKHILLIVGYEDLYINQFNNSCEYLLKSEFKINPILKLVIIRDLKNIMASRLNHPHMEKELRNSQVAVNNTRKLWQDHHKLEKSLDCQFIRYGNIIEDLKKVNLDSFFINHLKESQKVLNRYGGGSSFETNSFNSRYLNFLDDVTYESLIKDLGNLDKKIHGVVK